MRHPHTKRHARVQSDKVKAAAAASAKSKVERGKEKGKGEGEEKKATPLLLGPPTDSLPPPTRSKKRPSVRITMGPPKTKPPATTSVVPSAAVAPTAGPITATTTTNQAPAPAPAGRGRSSSRAMPSIVRRSRAASRALDNITGSKVPLAVQRSRALSRSHEANKDKVAAAESRPVGDATGALAGLKAKTGRSIAARVPVMAGTLGTVANLGHKVKKLMQDLNEDEDFMQTWIRQVSAETRERGREG